MSTPSQELLTGIEDLATRYNRTESGITVADVDDFGEEREVTDPAFPPIFNEGYSHRLIRGYSDDLGLGWKLRYCTGGNLPKHALSFSRSIVEHGAEVTYTHYIVPPKGSSTAIVDLRLLGDRHLDLETLGLIHYNAGRPGILPQLIGDLLCAGGEHRTDRAGRAAAFMLGALNGLERNATVSSYLLGDTRDCLEGRRNASCSLGPADTQVKKNLSIIIQSL